MLSRSLPRAILSARPSVLPSSASISHLPPTFLLPARARLFNSTTPIIEEPTNNTSILNSNAQTPPPPPSSLSPISTSTSIRDSSLHPSIPALLPLLTAQPPYYITAHIHARPYLLTAGDTLRLPFHMPRVVPGDILRLTRASVLGSRDYTLKGTPYVDERLFVCRARVVGVEAEPMRVVTKTKRRQRRIKRVKSKHRFTVLRVCEVSVRGVEDVVGERVDETVEKEG